MNVPRPAEPKKQSTIINSVASTFECVICRSVMHRPQFLTCCNRAVGCEQCISRWFGEHGSCPHCSTSGASYIDIKGIDDLLDQARTLHGDNVSDGQGSPSQSAEADSDSDFELPAVSFRHA